MASHKPSTPGNRGTAGIRGSATLLETGCDWPGCACSGEHRAPQSRARLDEYYWFCKEHARDYNRSWNYFDGIGETEFEFMQRSTATWDRPTWPLGDNGRLTAAGQAWKIRRTAQDFRANPLPGTQQTQRANITPSGHILTANEHDALIALGLDATATLHEVKKRYKQLVKRYHPDANSGADDPDRQGRKAQQKLRAVIQAYSLLVQRAFLTRTT